MKREKIQFALFWRLFLAATAFFELQMDYGVRFDIVERQRVCVFDEQSLKEDAK